MPLETPATEEVRPARAAQYLRTSTNHQGSSIQTQSEAIANYAAWNNISIVRTYKDEGRSGLLLNCRPALKALIRDVLLGYGSFDRVLVYDVSRWGRFQDSDEGAHYEFVCREAGVQIEYCSEDFLNNGSLFSGMMKSLKRVMAGEFSRELSNKVFAAHCHLNAAGFRQGGPPAYGLRRLLIVQNGRLIESLEPGQRKYLRSDRVILAPGREQQVSTVRKIFREFVLEKKSESRIARELNLEAIPNRLGGEWTHQSVKYVLHNECYIGTNIYNRHTSRLGSRFKANPPELWMRAENAFEAIVEPDIYWKAQLWSKERPKKKCISLSDKEMLAHLSSLLQSEGRLSHAVVKKANGLPSKSTYVARFGSMRKAYRLIGYRPASNLKFVDRGVFLTANFSKFATALINLVEQGGRVAAYDETARTVTIDGTTTISIYVARCSQISGGGLMWKVRRRLGLRGDWIVALRADLQCRHVLDYLLIPVTGFPQRHAEFTDRNPARLADRCHASVEKIYNAILESPGERYIPWIPRNSRTCRS